MERGVFSLLQAGCTRGHAASVGIITVVVRKEYKRTRTRTDIRKSRSWWMVILSLVDEQTACMFACMLAVVQMRDKCKQRGERMGVSLQPSWHSSKFQMQPRGNKPKGGKILLISRTFSGRQSQAAVPEEEEEEDGNYSVVR